MDNWMHAMGLHPYAHFFGLPLPPTYKYPLNKTNTDEFAPVKDAPGGAGDTPERARRMLSEEAKRWVKSAGAAALLPPVVEEGGEEEEPVSEISPLVSYKGEGLAARVGGKEVQLPVRFLS